MKKEIMPFRKLSFSYSRITLFGLAFLYFILPIGLQYLVGEDFYIYSKYQFQITGASVFYYLMLVITILAIAKTVKLQTGISRMPPSRKVLKTFVIANCFYLVIILIRGILLRRQGLDRLEMLEIISSQLIPGYGYLVLLSSIAIITLKSKTYLWITVIIGFAVDLVYQGKIFATMSLMLAMFYVDNVNYKFSIFRILMFALGGFSFLILIFLMRNIAAEGESGAAGVYTSFSEFMGVQSTAGWGYEYYNSRMPRTLFNFDPVLQEVYLKSVGHGLAISPVAYFIGNFGNLYWLYALAYFVIVFGLFYFSSKIIGRFALFVFMYNFIHMLRHGPDIFLYKSVLQIFVLVSVVFLLKSFRQEGEGPFN